MIKKYNQFIKESNENIDSICQKYKIQNYTINPDGTVDVNGNVVLDCLNLTELPLKFGKVAGTFFCGQNKLTNLKGCPREVGGNFSCNSNKLTNLEGCPREVGRDFSCNRNKLTSLEGSPQKVDGSFYCQNNELITLKGAPDKIPGNFSFYNNNLVNFKYLPLAFWYDFSDNPINEFLHNLLSDSSSGLVTDQKNLGIYLKLFEDIVQYPYFDDLEFEELAKTLKVKLPKDWRNSVKSYKMLSEF